MKLSKALFYFAIICVTTTLANYRHFPDRSTTFAEEGPSHSLPFLRNLENTDLNSQNTSSSHNKTKPVSVRLQGNTELGYYYVTLFFGSPVQKQTLIVDTGSTTTTIPCTECGKECGKNHFDKPFNHKNSKTFEEFKCEESFGDYSCYDCTTQCSFSVGYVEGSSYSGQFKKDYVAFGNEIEDNYAILTNSGKNAANTTQEKAEKQIRETVEEVIEDRKVFMPFGCTNKETKLFYDQEADGILGLGVNTNTQSSPPNLLDALHMQDSGFSKAFSLCLAQDGGYFTIGGHNSAYHAPEEKIHYTRYSDAFNQYKVTLHKIEFEGKDVGLTVKQLNTGEGAFFDSGTTLTHVPSATYNAIRDNLHNYCQADPKHCGNNAEAVSKAFCWNHYQDEFPTLASFYETFPTFKFYFGKENHAEYDWRGEDYLYLKDEAESLYCLGLSHYERESILGGTFMKNHDILFDKENKRIGFVRANCNGVQEVSKPVYLETAEPIQEPVRPSEPVALVYSLETAESPKTVTMVIGVMVVAFVGAAIGGTAYLYKRYKRRVPYQNMRNIRIEIPNSVISERDLDISEGDTPQSSNNQAPQQGVRARGVIVSEEPNSPQIQIDTDV